PAVVERMAASDAAKSEPCAMRAAVAFDRFHRVLRAARGEAALPAPPRAQHIAVGVQDREDRALHRIPADCATWSKNARTCAIIGNSARDALAALGAARVDHRAATRRFHPRAKAVGLLAMSRRRLESALHGKASGIRNEGKKSAKL